LVFGWPPSPILINKVLFFSLVWAIFLLSVLSNDNYWRRFFSGRLFVLLGTWSYSIYLVHWYFVMTMSSWPNHYFAASLSFLASILGGGILYLTVERPAEKARKLLRNVLTTDIPNAQKQDPGKDAAKTAQQAAAS
jgi:peptidoglycan/LPS O-acetylase OafA/YrhL